MLFIWRRWFQIFVSGFFLLHMIEKALLATRDLNYVLSVILLGSFLIPVTFIVYLYKTLPEWEVPSPAIAVCFLGDGVVGITQAENKIRSLGVTESNRLNA